MSRLKLFNKDPLLIISIVSFAFIFLIVAILDIKVFGGKSDNGALWEGVLVESHGLLMDIILFGIIIKGIEIQRDRKDKISRYKEEISDFRSWNEKEATYRIIGNIRRLNELGVTEIDLSRTFLEGADLEGLNLEDAILDDAILRNASLRNTSLKKAKLKRANLSGADVYNVDFTGVIFERTGYLINELVGRSSKPGGAYNLEFEEDKGNNNNLPIVSDLCNWQDAEYDEVFRIYVAKMNMSDN